MPTFRARVTYANVASTIALFLALGGGAYAAVGNPFAGPGGAIQGCVKRGGALIVVKSGRACPKHTTSLRFGQTGPQGIQGPQGVAGRDGAPGTPGKDGAPGTAVAYALISSTGTISNAKNVTHAHRAATGQYCLTASVPFQNVVITIDGAFLHHGFADANASLTPADVLGLEGQGCDASTNVLVHTFNGSAAATDEGFYILFN